VELKYPTNNTYDYFAIEKQVIESSRKYKLVQLLVNLLKYAEQIVPTKLEQLSLNAIVLSTFFFVITTTEIL
jgi:hypothetical protein